MRYEEKIRSAINIISGGGKVRSRDVLFEVTVDGELRCTKTWIMADFGYAIRHLVSHYSAIGDTISCDAPYSAIGFRGKLSLRCLPC